MGIARWAFISGAYSKGGSSGSSNWYPSSRHEDNGNGNYNSDEEKEYDVEFLKDENYRPRDYKARVRDLQGRGVVVRKYKDFFETGKRDLITFSNVVIDVKEGDGFIAGISFSETTSIWSFRKKQYLVIEIFVFGRSQWLFGTRIFSEDKEALNYRIKECLVFEDHAEMTMDIGEKDRSVSIVLKS